MADNKNKQLFLSLIYSFQMQTMMQLGKLANPMTGSIEKELDGAQVTIDMLDMLKAKSKGNTTEDETKFLDQIIADLKLNYVEERDKEKSESTKTDDKKISTDEAAGKTEKSKSEKSQDKKDSNTEETGEETKPKEKSAAEKDMDAEPLPPQE